MGAPTFSRQPQSAPRLERRSRRERCRFALICHDFDVPSRGDDVNKPDREVPADLPRVDFFHWVLVDLPPRLTQIAEGEFSRGFTPRGKPGPAALHRLKRATASTTTPAGSPATRRWPATTSATTVRSRRSTIRWCTTTCSRCTRCRVARAPVEGAFTGAAQVREAIYPHVLGEATHSGTYTLNQRLLGLMLASNPHARPRHPHHRDPPRRDGLERRHAHPGPARHPAQRPRALAGEAPRRARWPTRASSRSTPATCCAPRDRAGGGRQHGLPRASPTGPARACFGVFEGLTCAEIDRALARRGARAGASASSTSRPRAARPLRGVLRALRGAGLAHRGGPCRADHRARRARRRAGLPVPRRRRASTCRRRVRGSSAMPASTACSTPPSGLTLVGWSDTFHLEGDSLDESSDKVGSAA